MAELIALIEGVAVPCGAYSLNVYQAARGADDAGTVAEVQIVNGTVKDADLVHISQAERRRSSAEWVAKVAGVTQEIAYTSLVELSPLVEAALRKTASGGRPKPRSKVAPEGEPSATLRPSEETPAFPLATLPATCQAFVREAAASLVAPMDFIAVPLVVAAGAAVGNAVELELKPGWREGANLNAAIVGDPGSKKSPALNKALGPIFRIQNRLKKDFERELDDYRQALAQWEGDAKGTRGPKPESPAFRHVITTDATTEAVAAMLAPSKGVLLAKDELTGWVRSMDQYRGGGKGADRQHYLSMWARAPIKVDRRSNPIPIMVAHPHLSVTGGIQPDLLPDLADAAQREDGFLDRLLWAFPEKVADHWTTDSMSGDIVHAMNAIFDRLYELKEAMSEDGETVAKVVYLNETTAAGWVRWYSAHTAESLAEDFPPRLVGPWAKMPAQCARLMLILHLLEDSDSLVVTSKTLGAAADLIDYFKAMARRVYRLLGQQRRDLVVTILKALREQGPMNQRTILHDVFKRNVPAERIRGALDELEEAALVTHVEQKGELGRPATVWMAL